MTVARRLVAKLHDPFGRELRFGLDEMGGQSRCYKVLWVACAERPDLGRGGATA